jgi:hypothetical protein
MQAWTQPIDMPVDTARLLALLQEGDIPPVRTSLERRLKAMLLERGKRFCRCAVLID